jgi:catechol 2,3-dioxygenase-like lactoylglutathione lyase family enzyme
MIGIDSRSRADDPSALRAETRDLARSRHPLVHIVHNRQGALVRANDRILIADKHGAASVPRDQSEDVLMSDVQQEKLVLRTVHTGLTVSSLDSALEFWQGVMGFELLARRVIGDGPYVENIVGVPGANLHIAVLNTPDGHKIELLEYLSPADRQVMKPRSCDVGSAHLTFAVTDLDEMLRRVEAAGWNRLGVPQDVTDGPQAGDRVVYVRGPEGHTIEFFGR